MGRIGKKIWLSLLAAIVIVTVTSCLSTEKLEDEEELKIQTYISEHADVPYVRKSSGIYYADITVGTGIKPVTNDTAYIFYNAMYLSEVSFGTNIGSTDTLIAPVNVGFLIQGFDEAISYMNEGGKARAVVPSYLGYGNNSYYFPAYTPIVFDIRLVRVKRGPGAK
jgi:FKBP-type peptidyl-prolyl cis-trans isomerase